MFNSEGLPPEIRQTTQDIATGVTKGLVQEGKEYIKKLAQQFLNKELVFIEDQETIDIVKSQLKSGDWNILKDYIQDKKLKLLIQMGLALRDLEKGHNKNELINLRDKIFSKYQEEGLHIAQFVQCRLLVTYLTRITDSCDTPKEITDKIKNLLENLEFRVSFITSEDDPNTESTVVINR